MSDVTYGELYAATTRAAVPPDAKIAVELADGSGSYGHDIGELAASTAFSDLFAPIDVAAADVAFTPGSGLSSTNAQDAIEEAAGLIPSGYTDEEAQDAVAAMIVDGEGIDTSYNDGVPSLTISCEDASTSNKGVVELADVGELNTGTDTARVPSVDTIAGSIFGTESVSIAVFAAATALATGDGKFYFRIPTALNGMNLVSAAAGVFAPSSSGTPTIQLARGRQGSASSAHSFSDMLSTRITIDANEYDSKDATAAAVIDTSTDDVATGDLIRVDVDTAGTGTTGLFVTLGFRLP